MEHDDAATESMPSADQPLCPHCLAWIGERDHFCAACGGPITSHASIDPVGHILAEGYAYRQAVSGRPTVLVVLGVWAIFAPQLFVAVPMLVGSVRAKQSAFTFVSDIVLVAGIVLYTAILAKVTLKRFARPGPETDALT